MAAIRAGMLAGLLAWALAVALVAGPDRSSAQEQTRAVEGSVFNATPGGGGVGGLPVTLHQVSALGPLNLRTESDDQGRFRFDGISFDPALATASRSATRTPSMVRTLTCRKARRPRFAS